MTKASIVVVALAVSLSMFGQSQSNSVFEPVLEVEALATKLQAIDRGVPAAPLEVDASALAQKMIAEPNGGSCTTYSLPYAGISNATELWGVVNRFIPSSNSCYLSGSDPWDFWSTPVKAGERVTFAVETTVPTYFSIESATVYFGSTTLQSNGKYLGGYVWNVPSSFAKSTAKVTISPYAVSATYTLAVGKPVSNAGGCTASSTAACLLNNRFRVSIAYVNPFSNPPNQPGTFLAARLLQGAQNPDTALFGFSSPQAVEVVVRVQDTRPFAPRFDIYYGGMTDLGYTVTVTDTQTGATRQYVNNAGTVGGGVDRTSFPAN